MKIVFGDFNAKVGRENIFKLKIGNESLHQDSNGNCVRIINFATSKYLVNFVMYPHRNIPKCTWSSLDGKTHNQIDHILVDRRWHSVILNVRRLRGADSDNDHNLVVAKFKKLLADIKQSTQSFDGERFHLRKLHELEFSKKYQIEMTNKFATLENLSDDGNINRAWENIKKI